MADYPAHLTREHRLYDGRTVVIRAVRHNDDVLEREFLNELSGDSRYLRFHKWVHAPSDKLIHFLTDIDYERHLALACIASDAAREKLVGEARYVADGAGKNCEFGIMIADGWRKTGIAGLLMADLIAAARERGFATMEGMVLTRNSKMLKFARGLGFKVDVMEEDPATARIVKVL
jgi:GNAT superfamily N-acetyltransferase